MKKAFDLDFHHKLVQAVEKIEKVSGVEIVVALTPQSAGYQENCHWFSALTTIIILALLLFLETEFSVWLIFVTVLIAYPLTFFIINHLWALKRLITPIKLMQKNVEVHARATFQKGQLYQTRERIGVLFFISFFERIAYILPDTGAERLVPPEQWETISTSLQAIFTAPVPAESLLHALETMVPVFANNIPLLPDDINELPNDIQII
jgi:putative membrane protein